MFYIPIVKTKWFSPYPELLNLVKGYKPFRSIFRWSAYRRGYGTENKALYESKKALDEIQSNQKTIILHNPTLKELQEKKIEKIGLELIAAAPELDFILMSSRLPLNISQHELESWFLHPYDEHFSDYGAKIYGETIANILREKIVLNNNSVKRLSPASRSD